MQWRGPAVLVALLAIGAGSGYAASGATRDATIGVSVASPVPADQPGSPVEAAEPLAPDPDDPPLEPRIPMVPATLGSGKFEITFPVPRGWRSNTSASNEAKWKQPGTSNNSYVMRIEQITSQDMTVEQAVDTRVTRLRAEQDGFRPLDRGLASLEYFYLSNEGNARHSFMRWIDIDADGQADVEIVVHGREVDVLGTSDLISRVAAGVRRS